MLRSLIFCVFLFCATMALIASLLHGQRLEQRALRETVPANRELVAQLGLTDLAIWSEARYTRHPSQADSFAAFQDYPGSFDHFPAGSIIPPGSLRGAAALDVRKGQP